MKHKPIILCLSLIASFGFASAQDVPVVESDSTVVDSTLFPAPVTQLKAYDTDNDHGQKSGYLLYSLKWKHLAV